ncbi:ABC transporter substrate-binding protein [Actinocrispum wychmicini]|uniref:NitT/TauT family transport system substrate-binding protein n=1 Tax=Actinocrispum wychmicini TaxID=1213861 RepID=A0A4R2JDV1_9PSEU|nr:ABC transporter substrate-binding protein [Actinocrispum wychmicini]TCO52445.1 NitT/TauT family transport system substrate-binding protein [Actinocrispum wychmicini]
MRPKRRVYAGLLTAAMLATLGGCGLFGKASGNPAPTGGLEKSTIKVAELKIIDCTPIHMAIDAGYFKAEGLTVELSTGTKGSANLDNVMGGSADIVTTSYPPAIQAQAKKVSELKIVFDAVATTENLFLLVVKKDSPIKDLSALVGKKIAVSSPGGIGELALRAQFKQHNLTVAKESFLPMSFSDMPTALERGNVDAAIMNEPFITQALQQNGVTKLLTPFTGATADFPTSGWVATKKFVDANPKTVAAFQRAMTKAYADTQDRKKVEEATTKYYGVTANVASLMTLPVYPTTTDPTRFQRVVDLMHQVGELDPKLNVDMHDMVIESAPK